MYLPLGCVTLGCQEPSVLCTPGTLSIMTRGDWREPRAIGRVASPSTQGAERVQERRASDCDEDTTQHSAARRADRPDLGRRVEVVGGPASGVLLAVERDCDGIAERPVGRRRCAPQHTERRRDGGGCALARKAAPVWSAGINKTRAVEHQPCAALDHGWRVEDVLHAVSVVQRTAVLHHRRAQHDHSWRGQRRRAARNRLLRAVPACLHTRSVKYAAQAACTVEVSGHKRHQVE
eukprot:scaffold142738_cov136-Phaeocystis_antarctica.AAC.3